MGWVKLADWLRPLGGGRPPDDAAVVTSGEDGIARGSKSDCPDPTIVGGQGRGSACGYIPSRDEVVLGAGEGIFAAWVEATSSERAGVLPRCAGVSLLGFDLRRLGHAISSVIASLAGS